MTENAAGKRVIKKYPNRRLYDTNESKYVTLNDVRKLVLEETPFCVIDKRPARTSPATSCCKSSLNKRKREIPFFPPTPFSN